MKYSKLLISLFLAQGIVLTGCGGGGSSSGGGGSSSSSSSSASAWNLVWEDEFEGEAIDSTKWSHEVNCDGGGNNELQCYTASEENSFVEDGKLHIRVINTGGTGDDAYTSARLRTLDKGDWKYGRIEINAKMPEGQGLWPAIWMLPSEWVYGEWPLSGEIDILESVNPNGTGGNEVYGTLHYGQPWPNNVNTGVTYEPETNIWEEFHTFAIEWEEGEIRWYVDDKHFATQRSDIWYNYFYVNQETGFTMGEGAAPFDESFHLLLNVAVGGNFPVGQAGNSTEVTMNLPQEMVVDWVRVYECSADTVTGRGCAKIDRRIEPVDAAPATLNVATLYDNGISTLTFEVPGGTVDNTPRPQSWELAAGNVLSTPAYDMDGETVWDIEFNGLGNVYLISGDMSAEEAVNDGFMLKGMELTGEIKFDMYVESIDPETALAVKLDSGYPAVSAHTIDIPPVGEWTTVSVRFSEMAGTATHSYVVAPFVLESTGIAHVRLNNIRISCLGDCAVEPQMAGVFFEFTDSFDIYVDGELDPNWADDGIDVWNGAGQDITTTEVEDAEQGNVLEVEFLTGPGVMFVQTNILRDMTAFNGNGYMTFDLKLLEGSGNFAVKVDCVNPCSSGNIVLDEAAPLNTWHTFTVPISEFAAGGTNLSRVDTPFIILPMDGEAAKFRLNNIRWVYEEGTGGGGPEPIDTPTMEVYTNSFSADWPGLNIGLYNSPNSGGITLSTETDADAAHGEVLQAEFGADGDWNSTIFIQSGTAMNLSNFSDGNLVFDIKVVNAGSSSGTFMIKGEGGGTTAPGSESTITVNMDGAWHTQTVPVSVLKIPSVAAVNVPLSLWPLGGEQAGVVFQLDNIRWEQAVE